MSELSVAESHPDLLRLKQSFLNDRMLILNVTEEFRPILDSELVLTWAGISFFPRKKGYYKELLTFDMKKNNPVKYGQKS